MDKLTKFYIIAIDGEPASGKGTLAKSLARKLNISYMDTGAMYRAVGAYFLINNIELTKENIVSNLENINVVIKYIKDKMFVYLNDKDITEYIRSNEAGMAAHTVSQISEVRKRLVKMQQDMAKNESYVVDGQDIGTVVFKDALVKIFLVAGLDVRAKRRKIDFENKNQDITFEKVKEDLEKRTYDDYNRSNSPLKQAHDAIRVDNSKMTKEETLEYVYNIVKKRVEV